MRDLLALSTPEALPYATGATVAVLAVVSIVVLVPGIVVCGICGDSEPPVPSSNVHGESEHRKAGSSDSVPVAVSVQTCDPPSTFMPQTANVSQFDKPPPVPGVPATAVLQPSDNSLDAIAHVLHQMCDTMKGSIKPGKNIVSGKIRKGCAAVVADTTTVHGTEETIIFFSDRNCKQRQMKLYEQLNLKDSMPLVSLDTNAFSHTEMGCTAMLPSAIFVNRAKPLQLVMDSFKSPQERHQELLSVWTQITKLVKMFHARGWYLRDVEARNVVHVCMGGSKGWTLLEFGRASKQGKSVNVQSLDPRAVPPELATEMLMQTKDKVQLHASYDVWRLGMMVYEIMSAQTYWPSTMTDSDVLRVLACPGDVLPHEVRPLPSDVIQKVLMHMLRRDPAQRIDSSDLHKMMEEEVITASVVKTLNSGAPIHQQKPVQLNTA